MKKLSDVLAFVEAGGRPVVTFKKGIEDSEIYAEAGMRARIVGGRLKENDLITLTLDYSEFEQSNKSFESTNYFDKGGKPTLNARDAGFYQAVEETYFTPTDDTDKLFSVASEAVSELYSQFLASPGAVDGTMSYLAWLETSLVAERASASASLEKASFDAGNQRSVLDEARDIASDAFDGLVEFHPHVLTQARKLSVIRDAVADAFLSRGTGAPGVDYSWFKNAIESCAQKDESIRGEWAELAEDVCDDLQIDYPQAMSNEGRDEFIQRALAHIGGDGAFREIKDRESCRDRVKQLIAGDATSRQVMRADIPVN